MIGESRLKNVLAALVIGGAVYAAAKVIARGRAPQPMRVSEIYIHPVKSIGGYPVAEAELTKTGLKFDREWAVLKATDHTIVTQRNNSKMRTISARITQGAAPGTFDLQMSCAGWDTITIPGDALIPGDVSFHVWDLYGTATRVADNADDWLSQILGEPVILVRIHEHRQPHTQSSANITAVSDRIAMQDFSVLHVITDGSLAWIRRACGDSDVDATRFRPNIVVAGTANGDEMTWLRFTVGDIALRTAKLTSRCVMPSLNKDGQRHPKGEPTATLREQRNLAPAYKGPGASKQPMFGISVFSDAPGGVIRVGDLVTITERGALAAADGV